MWYLYENANGTDYVLYIGASINLSTTAATNIGRNITIATGPTDVTFASLQGKVGTLVLTSSISDPADSGVSVPSDTSSKLLAFTTNLYLGTNVKLRNSRYNFTTVYAQGNSIVLDRGSYDTTGGLTLYGGNNKGSVNGDINVNIGTTGGATTIYGGNADGTVTGNINVMLVKASGVLSYYGGNNKGTVDGSITTKIYGSTGALSAFYG